MDIKFEDYILIRKTIIEMMYDRSEQPLQRFFFERGSLDIFKMIPDYAIRDIFDQSQSSVKNKNALDMELQNDKQRVIIHFVSNASKINKDIISTRDFYALASNDHLICILCTNNKPDHRNLQTDINNTEIFWYKSLTFNITKHSLVPRHELLEKYKINELKKAYYLTSVENLPTILAKDPVAKYYNMRHGDICKITRHISTVGDSISYRFVSDKE